MDLDKSSIERLKRTLYSRNENVVPKEHRTPVSLHENNVPTNWGDSPSFDLTPETMAPRNNKFFNRFLVGSLVFFFAALAVALFIFFGGINMISSNNLDIKITAPNSISSGEELLVGLTIVNANRTDLEEVSLFIDYPEGSEKVGNGNKVATRDRIDLGRIARGKSLDYSVRSVLFGEKDAVKTFNFKLEYKVKGSNAVFSKEKTLPVIIGSSPTLLNVSYPKEVNSGQQITLTIDVTSNSNVPIKNVLIKADYPYGFTYKDSNVKPLRDNSVWNVGDMKNGDKKTITVTGSILGQNLEDRSFKFFSGTQNLDASQDFDTALAVSQITIGIRKSFFDLKVTLGTGVAQAGQIIPVSLKWTNTLPDKILNGHIEAIISGDILDRGKVSIGENGFYRSVDNTVIWDKNSTDVLGSILPGGSGNVSISLASLNNPQALSIKNPHIDLRVTMTGDRSGIETGTVSSEENITIKIASNLVISAKTYRNVGPFTNSGTIPPRADKESTYTITWTLTNTTNNLKDAVAFTTLPPGVSWKSLSFPTTEKISFNPDTRIVTWDVGSVSSGVGFAYSPKTVSFKVGLTPSVNNIGTSPLLTGEVDAEAMDTYTANLIKVNAPAVNTHFSDPSFVSGNDMVVK